MGMNDVLPPGNQCAIVRLFARALNPCVVAVRPVLFAQSNVRGVPLGKPPAGKTVAVIWDASKYLGVSAPSSSRGHRASCSRKREAPWLKPWGVSRTKQGLTPCSRTNPDPAYLASQSILVGL